MASKWGSGVGLGVVALALTSGAHAQEGTWLSWAGPLECRNTPEVERQIESLLGRTVDFARVPVTHVQHEWSQSRGWSLAVHVSLPTGKRTRAFHVSTCRAGFDLVALTLALILEPELGAEPGDLSASPPHVPEASVVATTDEEASAPSLLASVGENGSFRVSPSEPPAQPPAQPPAPTEAQIDRAPTNEGDSRRRGAQLTLGAAARVDLGSMPALLVGAGPQLGFRTGGWRMEAGAELLTSAEDTLRTAQFPTVYSTLFGVAHACRDFPGASSVHFGTCIGAQLGRVSASERGGERRSGSGLWAALSAGAELGVGLGAQSRGFARLHLVFPLVRHGFALAGGGTVHELPPVTAQFQLGLAFELTDWGER